MNRSDLSRFDPLSGGYYPGGKGYSGVAQRIINRMPPHQVYIEPFLGGGAVMRYKRPAQLNIGIDADPEVIERWCAAAPQFSQAPADAAKSGDAHRRPPRSPASHDRAASPATSQRKASLDRSSSAAEFGGEVLRYTFLCADGIEYLRNYPWSGRELVYCDPPYLHSTRRDLKLYACEMSADQHWHLLEVLKRIPCPVLLSGYRSDLYARYLDGWRSRFGEWTATNYQTMTRRGLATETLWANFPPPTELHDYRYLGEDRRERERIKRMQASWLRRLAALDPLERQALLSALRGTDCAGAPAPSVLSNSPFLPSTRLGSSGLGQRLFSPAIP